MTQQATPEALGDSEMGMPLSLDVETLSAPPMASRQWINNDGLLDILADVVRLATDDFRYRRPSGPHMPADEFLRHCGLLTEDGQLDRHGHQLPGLRTGRPQRVRVGRMGQGED